jgi:hypothetical protein
MPSTNRTQLRTAGMVASKPHHCAEKCHGFARLTPALHGFWLIGG